MMNSLPAAVLGITLVACGASSPQRRSQATWQPLSPAEQAAADARFEANRAEIWRQLEPAVTAYRKGDRDSLLAWTSEPGRTSAYMTFGAGLLVRAGASDAEGLFVKSFPATERSQLRLFEMFESALMDAAEDVAFDPQAMLICGALRQWSGAVDKLVAVRQNTDAGSYEENCCGLALYAASFPEDAIVRFATAGLKSDLLHAFEEEASSASARQLLVILKQSKFDDAPAEDLRVALIPILKAKAAGRSLGVCAWIRCEEWIH